MALDSKHLGNQEKYDINKTVLDKSMFCLTRLNMNNYFEEDCTKSTVKKTKTVIEALHGLQCPQMPSILIGQWLASRCPGYHLIE